MKILNWLFFVMMLPCFAIAQNNDEKIYLHTDKDYYQAGDTIWFKAYLYSNEAPSTLSKNFYIDLFDDRGNLLFHNTSPIMDGTSNGQIALSPRLERENLLLKAYTKESQKNELKPIYQKALGLVGPSHQLPTKQDNKLLVEFFPEGGTLVSGLNNMVAYKVTNETGLPVDATIKISDSKKTLANVQTQNDGMGKVQLAIEENEHYYAEVQSNDGAKSVLQLTSSRTDIPLLRVGGTELSRTFEIVKTDKYINEKISIVGRYNGIEVFSINKPFVNNKISGNFAANDYPLGILTITIYDGQTPLAERVCFVGNRKLNILSPKINFNKFDNNRRGYNVFSIDSIADISNLSIAVTDADYPSNNEDNIVSEFLLASETKGYIHRPIQYFISDDPVSQQNLDLVMLTNGWRKYRQEVTNAQSSTDEYLTLSGTIKDYKFKQRKENTLLYNLNQHNNKTNFRVIKIKQDGSFIDDELLIFDTATINYQISPLLENDKTVTFFVDKLQPTAFDEIKDLAALSQTNKTLPSLNKKYLLEIDYSKYPGLLQEVKVQKKVVKPDERIDKKYTSGMFSNDGRVVDVANDRTALAMGSTLKYIVSKFPSFTIDYTNGNPILVSVVPVSINAGGRSPALFLNEMRTNEAVLESTTLDDIALIKYMAPPFLGVAYGAPSGAIAVYTKKGRDDLQTANSQVKKAKIIGYNVIKEFYQPDYAHKENLLKLDNRSTLFWKAQLITSPGNAVELGFYNSDEAKRMKIVVQGFTKNGSLVYSYKELQ